MAAHEGLVRLVVRRQQRGGLPFADALHEGRLGLWRALRGYDGQRGTRFSSYAVPAIERAVWRAVAQAELGVGPAVEDVVEPSWWEDPADELHRAAVRAAIRALVAELPPGPRRIVAAHHGLAGGAPVSLAALGRQLGVSRQRVHAVYQAALVWLAQPERSRAVRELVGRSTRTDYQRTLARSRRLARTRRGERGRRRCRR
ncbi:MAG TPA: sigma-70 family RNA polymerase sigma factor [Actinomycetes bacterium]|nr:sigma-70 family RNA polymerase sigma factor [Actinomycetes bacterium]